MSLIRMLSGRKKECTVWQWFRYDDVQCKIICLALTKEGSECGLKLAGKNTTNLKVTEQPTTLGLLQMF